MARYLRIALCLMGLMLMTTCSFASSITSDGYYNGIRLAGKVRVVNHFGDIKVKVVNSFPDLKVQAVNYFPDDIGQWQFVSYGEDFTIEYVNSFPDITIQFVKSFPGVP